MNGIRAVIRNNDLHKQKHVDIILEHDDRGFLGIISSKKQGIPENPGNLCRISNNNKSIEQFKTWVKEWDYAYSPKGLKEFKKLQEILFKDKKFIAIMKKFIQM